MNWKRIFASVCIFGVLIQPGCAGAPEPQSDPSEPEEQAVTFTDDLGRSVTVQQPERVAALIGSFADMPVAGGF